MFQTKMVTAPASGVLTVAELKEYLRVDSTAEDTTLELMERAAVLKLEDLTSLKFITQVWDVFMDYWPLQSSSKWWDGVRDTAISEVVAPKRNITLPLGIANSLVQFATYSDDEEFLEDTSNYIFDNVGFRARVGLKLGGVWPTTILRSNNAIRFRLNLGFGDATAIPTDIKLAVRALVAHMYEHRGDEEKQMAIPAHVLTLVAQYRREKLGC